MPRPVFNSIKRFSLPVLVLSQAHFTFCTCSLRITFFTQLKTTTLLMNSCPSPPSKLPRKQILWKVGTLLVTRIVSENKKIALNSIENSLLVNTFS